MSEYRAALFAESKERSWRASPDGLAELKARIARIERSGCTGSGDGDVLPTGFRELDAALSEGGLSPAGVHEVAGSAADGFLLRLLSAVCARRAGPVLWCMPASDMAVLYGPGLVTAGFDPARLVIARFRTRTEGLWAMEEGLRAGAFAAVVGQLDGGVDLTASRRLQLAAETGRTPGFVRLDARGGPSPNALATRWSADAAPAAIHGDGRVARRWTISLLRSRGGGEGYWTVDVDG